MGRRTTIQEYVGGEPLATYAHRDDAGEWHVSQTAGSGLSHVPFIVIVTTLGRNGVRQKITGNREHIESYLRPIMPVLTVQYMDDGTGVEVSCSF